MRRFELERRWGGWWSGALKGLLLALLWAPLVVILFGSFQLLQLASSIPELPDLEPPAPAVASRVETLDGMRLAGSGAAETRHDELPPIVVTAFLAAEDENFFSHGAFSLRGILRAAFENIRAGETREGASTITQQVAGRYLSRDRTYERKVSELLLARRIEANHGKHEILEAYLEGIYFGERATGISQAAWTYFQKPANELELHEAATLAGLLPAPSVYNPFENPHLAMRERARVLRRMEAIGVIDAETRSAAAAVPLGVSRDSLDPTERVPDAAETAIRALKAHTGVDSPGGEAPESWSEDGFRVVVTTSPAHRSRIEASLRAAIIEHDERQGWRGSPAKSTDPRLVDALAAQPDGRWRWGMIEAVARDEATVDAGLPQTVALTLEANRWAEPADTPRHFKRPVELSDLRRALEPGDVVLLRREESWRLAQLHDFEGAYAAIHSPTGEVLATVGAFDPGLSAFDRAELGCRQPGSVFKPIVYAEAFHRGVTPATMLSDGPVEVATGRGGVWRPRNADRDFKGYVTAADALVWSRNIPTIHVMEHVGVEHVVSRARKLGIESPIDTTSSASLGASCVRPTEVARAYLAFQRAGRRADPFEVATILDRDGVVVSDRAHFALADDDVTARLARMGGELEWPSVGVSENVAFIMLDLLRKVATSGTAHELPDDWIIGGKTGTTNAYDAWFVGLDGEWTSVVWVGSDENARALGRGEHGATVAMPAFERFWTPFAQRASGEIEWPGEPPIGAEYVAIDPATGLRAPSDEWGVPYPFVKGTAPTEEAPSKGTKQAQRAEELLYDF